MVHLWACLSEVTSTTSDSEPLRRKWEVDLRGREWAGEEGRGKWEDGSGSERKEGGDERTGVGWRGRKGEMGGRHPKSVYLGTSAQQHTAWECYDTVKTKLYMYEQCHNMGPYRE